MIKVMVMFKRKKGMTPEEFSKHWTENHAKLALQYLPGTFTRYVQNHAVRLEEGGEPRFDGITEFWFDDIEGWKKVISIFLSEEGKVFIEDEKRFIDRDSFVYVITEEKVIVP